MKTGRIFALLYVLMTTVIFLGCDKFSTSLNSRNSSQFESSSGDFTDSKKALVGSSLMQSRENKIASPQPNEVGLSLDWKSFQKTDLIEEAIRVTNHLTQRFPDSADAHEAKARVLLLIGKTDEAEISWNRCLQLDPNYGYAFHGLGLIETKKANFKDAIAYYKEALDRIQNYKDSIRELSDAYLKDGQIELSAKSLEDFLAVNPNDSEFWLRLGQTYNAGLNFSKAKTAFEQSLSLAEENPKAEQGLITALIRLGERERAREFAERLKARPKRENDSIDQLLQNERIDIAARYWLAALVYRNFKCYGEAELLLERASIYDPSNAKVLESLIEQYMRRSNYEAAFQKALQLTDLDKTNPNYAFGVASLAEKLKQDSVAVDFYRRVINLAPNDPKAYKQLTSLLLNNLQKPEAAESIAKSWIEKETTAVPLAFLASAQVMQGNMREAEHSLIEALKLDPNSNELRSRLSQVQKALAKQD